MPLRALRSKPSADHNGSFPGAEEPSSFPKRRKHSKSLNMRLRLFKSCFSRRSSVHPSSPPQHRPTGHGFSLRGALLNRASQEYDDEIPLMDFMDEPDSVEEVVGFY